MALAIFDLDNTLLAGDSDHRWGEFLVEIGLVESSDFAEKNNQFYSDYQSGDLDMTAYLQFVLAPLRGKTREEIRPLQEQFMRSCIEPMLLDHAFELLQRHRVAGDILLMITATHSVVAEPVAARLGFEHCLASEAEIRDGRFTGRPAGTPCFQTGKVQHLERWESAQPDPQPLKNRWFYSDSHNDLALLKEVEHPVAVDPDPILLAYAKSVGWEVISLRP